MDTKQCSRRCDISASLSVALGTSTEGASRHCMPYLHIVLKGCFLSPGEETLTSQLVSPVITETCWM